MLVTKHTRYRSRPAGDNSLPSAWHRLLVFPLLFVPWLVMYEWVVYALACYLPDEVHWPIWQWTEVSATSYWLTGLFPFSGHPDA